MMAQHGPVGTMGNTSSRGAHGAGRKSSAGDEAPNVCEHIGWRWTLQLRLVCAHSLICLRIDRFTGAATVRQFGLTIVGVQKDPPVLLRVG